MSQNTKITLKHILTHNQNWWHFYEKNAPKIRIAILVCIVKLLSCRNTVRGYKMYHCANPECHYVKQVPFTCKCKACSSCGKKATEVWLQKQTLVLPDTPWQHITFTMPSELWNFFWLNRSLLNLISAIAAKCIKKIAKKKKLLVGIFVAIHTFGRDLKRNVHIHLSVTTGGLSHDKKQWENIFFHQTTLMRMWRYDIIALFHKMHQQRKLSLPPSLQKKLNHTFTFSQFLQQLYQKFWRVHCAKPSDNYKKNLAYFSRYIKRPPIAESRLKHYNGSEVTFRFLDHKTKTYRLFTLSHEQFISRFIWHIPDIGFRMIRYYGFLANRVRGTLLPIVSQVLGLQPKEPARSAPTYLSLMLQNFNVNPLACILCGKQLLFSGFHFGKTSVFDLLPLHKQFALLQTI